MIINKACIVCETPFSKEVGPNAKRTKYCSRKCHDTAKRVNRYGMTFQDLNNRIKDQNGKCLICKREFSNMLPKNINIDHDHETGEVRGILCVNCNQGLGQFREDVESLKAAIEYLNK